MWYWNHVTAISLHIGSAVWIWGMEINMLHFVQRQCEYVICIIEQQLRCSAVWIWKLFQQLRCSAVWICYKEIKQQLRCSAVWICDMEIEQQLRCSAVWICDMEIEQQLRCSAVWVCDMEIEQQVRCSALWIYDMEIEQQLRCSAVWICDMEIMPDRELGIVSKCYSTLLCVESNLSKEKEGKRYKNGTIERNVANEKIS